MGKRKRSPEQLALLAEKELSATTEANAQDGPTVPTWPADWTDEEFTMACGHGERLGPASAQQAAFLRRTAKDATRCSECIRQDKWDLVA
jgi:hypothetical protein